MEKSYRSFAKYGTVCEIIAFPEQTQTIVFNPYDREDRRTRGSTTVRAMGMHRFRIDRVLHRALDGLILTCEVSIFHEEGTDEDIRLSETEEFEQIKKDAIEYCRASAALSPP